MAKTTINFNRYLRESKREDPVVVLPDGREITLPLPDGDLTMMIEEAGQTRKALRLAFGDQWDDVEDLIKSIKDPAMLREFTMDILKALGVAADDGPPAGGSR